MGVNSEKLQLHQIDGGNNNSVHSEKWVVAGIAVRSPVLKPIFTKRMEKTDEDDQDQACSTTPTYAESRIPIRFACPPAPKKRKKASSRSCHYNYGGVVVRDQFFNPPDLETIFIRRVEGA